MYIFVIVTDPPREERERDRLDLPKSHNGVGGSSTDLTPQNKKDDKTSPGFVLAFPQARDE
jgi:hypothetical protein